MNFVLAKAKKRDREGKETVFFHNGSQITAAKIENFKRRKIIENAQEVSPCPGE